MDQIYFIRQYGFVAIYERDSFSRGDDDDIFGCDACDLLRYFLALAFGVFLKRDIAT